MITIESVEKVPKINQELYEEMAKHHDIPLGSNKLLTNPDSVRNFK
jgi:hypothetical protein